ncbi:MAG: hypothetical protein EOP06_03790 [Proteobacteria bacterium]|nr:MAG: hypothetical protein EOP06_03790 [Pseudomonadota bacterium]
MKKPSLHAAPRDEYEMETKIFHAARKDALSRFDYEKNLFGSRIVLFGQGRCFVLPFRNSSRSKEQRVIANVCTLIKAKRINAYGAVVDLDIFLKASEEELKVYPSGVVPKKMICSFFTGLNGYKDINLLEPDHSVKKMRIISDIPHPDELAKLYYCDLFSLADKSMAIKNAGLTISEWDKEGDKILREVFTGFYETVF